MVTLDKSCVLKGGQGTSMITSQYLLLQTVTLKRGRRRGGGREGGKREREREEKCLPQRQAGVGVPGNPGTLVLGNHTGGGVGVGALYD